jgi:hypothetical protein
MSNSAQILANQQNAAHSTGPSTPAGKAVSSHNATTHGLSGHFAVLPHEDLGAFHKIRSGYLSTFQPGNEHEDFLVETMVQSRWKLARLKRMEAALIQQMCGQDTERTNPDAVVAAAMLAGSANAYGCLQRYQAAAERSYYRAKQELDRERARTAKPAPVQNKPKSTNIFDYLKPSTIDDYIKRNPQPKDSINSSSSTASSKSRFGSSAR